MGAPLGLREAADREGEKDRCEDEDRAELEHDRTGVTEVPHDGRKACTCCRPDVLGSGHDAAQRVDSIGENTDAADSPPANPAGRPGERALRTEACSALAASP